MRKLAFNNIGKWGNLREKIMKKNNPQILISMRKNNTLSSYLENYQNAMEQRVELLLNKIRKERGINKDLWRTDPFEFVIRDIEAQSDVKTQLEEEIINSK